MKPQLFLKKSWHCPFKTLNARVRDKEQSIRRKEYQQTKNKPTTTRWWLDILNKSSGFIEIQLINKKVQYLHSNSKLSQPGHGPIFAMTFNHASCPRVVDTYRYFSIKTFMTASPYKKAAAYHTLINWEIKSTGPWSYHRVTRIPTPY